MLRIGVVGFGFMGRMHFGNWSKVDGASVVAICDGNPDILKDLDKTVGNIEGLPEHIDLSQIHFCTDYEQMLQSEQLEAVSITLPTHLHKDFSIKALQAGVHVLCEKPMALTLEDCDEMIAAAKTAERTLMIGHCIRFWPEYAKTKEIIDSGQYGRVLSATFRRFSQPPVWSSDNWMMDAARSGGMILDLHIHDTDFIHYLFGIPNAVRSYGLTDPSGVRCIQTRYDYGDESIIAAEGSWLMTKSFGFEMSFTISLEKATIVYDCTRDPAFKVCPVEGDAFMPEVKAGDGYLLEIEHFVEMILGKQSAEIISPDQSRKSIQIIQAEQQSVLENRTVKLE